MEDINKEIMHHKDVNNMVFIKNEKSKLTEVKLYKFSFGISIMDNKFREIRPDYVETTEREFNKAFRQALKKLI